MATMRAVQVSEPGGALELVQREAPEPGYGEVRVRVHACGVCHSDAFAVQGGFPGVTYPVVPGHEIAGAVDAVGEGVQGWTAGQRVGVGWYGGNCGWCEWCRRGSLIDCQNMGIPGVTMDGGYADYVVVRASALAALPEQLAPEEAGPLLCAGITTFNALRQSGVRPGQRVAVLGIGGLGHLGVQFAVKMGLETIAVARGREKQALALKLGAHHYIDSTASNPGQALQDLGGVDIILSTVTAADAMTDCFSGLRPRGKLIVVGAAMSPLQIPAGALIGGSKAIVGHASGTAQDSEDTLSFSVLAGVHPMVETFPLERAAAAYQKMLSGQARFRMVITTGASQSAIKQSGADA